MYVELRDVTKRFGRVTALDAITLRLEAGSRTALIGPNGSGKSTLTRILLGVLACEGEVRIGGWSPGRDRAELARRSAYVPQTAPLLAAAVGEIVEVVCRLRAVEPGEVARTAARLDLELAAVAGKPVRALSGGMRQKLLLALAFATDASLLILDEPTASLDARARQAFFGLMAERARDATLLLCSHRLDEVRHLVDHVVALESGRIAYHGPVEDYLRTRACGVLEVRLGAQAAAGWLSERGFRPGAAGAWARTVTQEEKLPLLRQVLAAYNGGLESVQVRDLETIEAGGPGASGEVRPSARDAEGEIGWIA